MNTPPTTTNNTSTNSGLSVPPWSGQKFAAETAVSPSSSALKAPSSRLAARPNHDSKYYHRGVQMYNNNNNNKRSTTQEDRAGSSTREILEELNMYADDEMEDLLNGFGDQFDSEVKFELDVLIEQIAEIDRQLALLDATEHPFLSFAAPNIVRDPVLQHVDVNSSGGGIIIAIALQRDLWIFDAAGKRPHHLLARTSASDYFTSVSWCPSSSDDRSGGNSNNNSHILAAGKSDGSLTLYDCERLVTLRTVPDAHHSGRLSSIAWRNSNDANCLTSGGADGRIVHYDSRVKTGTLLEKGDEYNHHKGEVCCLQWNPEGTVLASGGTDRALLLWASAAAGGGGGGANRHRPVAGFVEREAPAVQAVAWSQSERGLLAVGGGPKGGHVKFLNTLTSSKAGCIATGNPITALAWNDINSNIVSSHASSKICSWSYPTLSLVKEYAGHSEGVLHLGIAGSSVVFSAGADEIVNLWQL